MSIIVVTKLLPFYLKTKLLSKKFQKRPPKNIFPITHSPSTTNPFTLPPDKSRFLGDGDGEGGGGGDAAGDGVEFFAGDLAERLLGGLAVDGVYHDG